MGYGEPGLGTLLDAVVMLDNTMHKKLTVYTNWCMWIWLSGAQVASLLHNPGVPFTTEEVEQVYMQYSSAYGLG